MLSKAQLQSRLQLVYHAETFRRTVGHTEVVIHCHHYNARIQEALENSRQVNGKQILLSVAEAVFSNWLMHLFSPQDEIADKRLLTEALYAHLGYGSLDLSHLDEGIITASASHFVEGWIAGFQERTLPVCTFTEGYLQGAIYAMTGELVRVREQTCMIAEEPFCRFIIDHHRTEPLAHYPKETFIWVPAERPPPIMTSHLNPKEISNDILKLPIYGNHRGLIPMFGVYLAHIPVDFLNWVTIQFVAEMKKKQLFHVARQMMIDIAENCGINTFSGFLSSSEWKQLVAPKIQTSQDKLFAIIAMSNVLGWGNWQIVEHRSTENLILESLNGYEALGIKELGQLASVPQCFMLTGVAAGVMSLIYGQGSLKDRFGMYTTEETQCIACGDPVCLFEVNQT